MAPVRTAPSASLNSRANISPIATEITADRATPAAAAGRKSQPRSYRTAAK